jgi:hypothetical protein
LKNRSDGKLTPNLDYTNVRFPGKTSLPLLVFHPTFIRARFASTRVFFLLSLAIIEPDTKRLSDSDPFGIDFPNLFLQ